LLNSLDAEWQKLPELVNPVSAITQSKKSHPRGCSELVGYSLVWWPEYHPEQMQALPEHRCMRGKPGTKYDAATLAEWLQGKMI